MAFTPQDDTNEEPADGERFIWGGEDETHRWQITSPPLDTLRAYRDWSTSLNFALESGDQRRILDMASELAEIAQDMPAQWVGRRGPALAELGTIVRFNRVQGPSLGAAYQFELAWPFTTVTFRGRFGLSDHRPLAGVVLTRDLPSGLWEWSLERRLADVDPWSRGLNVANTVNALFAGHDDAEYVLTDRLGVTYTRRVGATGSWSWSLGAENHQTVGTVAESRVNDVFFGDGIFRPNRPARDRLYGALATRYDVRGSGVKWSLGADALAGGELVVGRLWSDLEFRKGPLRAHVAAGATTRPDVPQRLLRAGGPLTVRGYDYGERLGEAMWSAQIEAALRPGAFVNPYVFSDIGNADRFADILSAPPLIGIGGGVALNLYVLEARLQLSKALGKNNGEPACLDLLFRPPL